MGLPKSIPPNLVICSRFTLSQSPLLRASTQLAILIQTNHSPVSADLHSAKQIQALLHHASPANSLATVALSIQSARK